MPPDVGPEFPDRVSGSVFSRRMFELVDFTESERCAPCPDAARWPYPRELHDLGRGDEIELAASRMRRSERREAS